MKRLRFPIVLFALLAAACGGDAQPPSPAPPGAAPEIDLPPATRAFPAYAAILEDPATQSEVDAVTTTPGVKAAAFMPRAEVPVRAGATSGTMIVGAVDPLEFRPLTPTVTRRARFVWSSLLRGDAVVTFDAAEEMGISGSENIELGGTGEVKVGAYADNGVPNYADILVSESLGAELGLDNARLAIIGSKKGTDVEALRERLEQRLSGAQLVNLLPRTPGFLSAGSPEIGGPERGLIPTMPFELAEGGFIEPDEAWVKQNITTAQVPIIGEVTCHRIMVPRLFQALAEIEREGLAGLIRPADYGGCYVPRFIDRDPKNPLSMHAFGLAVDLNVSTNLLGTAGDMDERIVAIFNKWGFTWGGIWDRPDPMHFELARLVDL